jgi:transcription-repair coupling factor (superfamily II helicase)
VLASILAVHPRTTRRRDMLEASEERKTLVVLGMIGAVVASLVLIDQTMAFVIFGIGGLIRFRTVVGNSHMTGRAILVVVIGLACGLSQYATALVVAAAAWLIIWWLQARRGGEIKVRIPIGADRQKAELVASLELRMLRCHVRSLRAGKEPDLDAPLAITTEINLHATAVLPENYCADVHERLVLYKRLANCESLEELEALSEELVDRFGLLPEPARTLVDTHRLRILSRPLGVMRIDAGANAVQIQFIPNPPVDPQKVIALVRGRPGHRLTGSEKLRIDVPLATTGERVELLRKTLQALQ